MKPEFRYRTNWRGKLILQIKYYTVHLSIRNGKWRDAKVTDLNVIEGAKNEQPNM